MPLPLKGYTGDDGIITLSAPEAFEIMKSAPTRARIKSVCKEWRRVPARVMDDKKMTPNARYVFSEFVSRFPYSGTDFSPALRDIARWAGVGIKLARSAMAEAKKRRYLQRIKRGRKGKEPIYRLFLDGRGPLTGQEFGKACRYDTIPLIVWKNGNVTSYMKAVFRYLYGQLRKNTYCWPSARVIGKAVGVSRQRAVEATNALMREGFIIKVNQTQGGRNLRNQYLFRDDVLALPTPTLKRTPPLPVSGLYPYPKPDTLCYIIKRNLKSNEQQEERKAIAQSGDAPPHPPLAGEAPAAQTARRELRKEGEIPFRMLIYPSRPLTALAPAGCLGQGVRHDGAGTGIGAAPGGNSGDGMAIREGGRAMDRETTDFRRMTEGGGKRQTVDQVPGAVGDWWRAPYSFVGREGAAPNGKDLAKAFAQEYNAAFRLTCPKPDGKILTNYLRLLDEFGWDNCVKMAKLLCKDWYAIREKTRLKEDRPTMAMLFLGWVKPILWAAVESGKGVWTPSNRVSAYASGDSAAYTDDYPNFYRAR